MKESSTVAGCCSVKILKQNSLPTDRCARFTGGVGRYIYEESRLSAGNMWGIS